MVVLIVEEWMTSGPSGLQGYKTRTADERERGCEEGRDIGEAREKEK